MGHAQHLVDYLNSVYYILLTKVVRSGRPWHSRGGNLVRKRRVHVRKAALVGLITLANGVVAIATDYSDFEPTTTATGTLLSDFSAWERTSASGSEGLAAVRSTYIGVVRDQEGEG